LIQGSILTCCPDLWLHMNLFQGSLTPLQQKHCKIEMLVLPKQGGEAEKLRVPIPCVMRATRGLWVEACSSSRKDTTVPSLLACSAPCCPKHGECKQEMLRWN